jgi:hypothetical protein
VFSPIEHWRHRTRQYVRGLLQRIDELSVSDYPGTTPNQVIKFLQDFLGVIEVEISKAGSEDKLRVLSQLTQKLGEFVQWLDNAHTGQTPRGPVQLLKDMMNGLVPNSRVIACPRADYNYSILELGQYINGLVQKFVPLSKQAAFAEHVDKPIKLILFPRIERDNVLTHAIFGHELGHPIATEFLDKEASSTTFNTAQTTIQQQVDALVAAQPDASTMDAAKKLDVVTSLVRMVLEIRKRALEELISDAVGIILFGPSAFFAMFEVLWVGNWDSPPKSDSWYPPSRMRIRMGLMLLDDLGWPQAIDQLKSDPAAGEYANAMLEFLNEAKHLADVRTDEQVIDGNPVLKIAYDWMHSTFKEATLFSKQRVEVIAFKSTKITDLSGLLERLELGVPPNELGTPLQPITVDYRSALLAGWAFKLRGLNPSSPEPLSERETDRLNQNTLRAVEYILLQDDYRKVMAQEMV